MHKLWDLIAAAHRDNDVLDHPFYRRWSRGELTRQELALYAGQYGHVVRALPEALRRASQDAPSASAAELVEHAKEEAWHAHLWSKFAAWTGAGIEPTEPTNETTGMTAAMLDFSTWQEGLIGVYAIESTQGPVAASKLRGLAGYGLIAGSGVYFKVHMERDLAHADELRRQLEGHLDTNEGDQVDRAKAIWRANWALLDGVERLAELPDRALDR